MLIMGRFQPFFPLCVLLLPLILLPAPTQSLNPALGYGQTAYGDIGRVQHTLHVRRNELHKRADASVVSAASDVANDDALSKMATADAIGGDAVHEGSVAESAAERSVAAELDSSKLKSHAKMDEVAAEIARRETEADEEGMNELRKVGKSEVDRADLKKVDARGDSEVAGSDSFNARKGLAEARGQEARAGDYAAEGDIAKGKADVAELHEIKAADAEASDDGLLRRDRVDTDKVNGAGGKATRKEMAAVENGVRAETSLKGAKLAKAGAEARTDADIANEMRDVQRTSIDTAARDAEHNMAEARNEMKINADTGAKAERMRAKQDVKELRDDNSAIEKARGDIIQEEAAVKKAEGEVRKDVKLEQGMKTAERIAETRAEELGEEASDLKEKSQSEEFTKKNLEAGELGELRESETRNEDEVKEAKERLRKAHHDQAMAEEKEELDMRRNADDEGRRKDAEVAEEMAAKHGEKVAEIEGKAKTAIRLADNQQEAADHETDAVKAEAKKGELEATAAQIAELSDRQKRLEQKAEGQFREAQQRVERDNQAIQEDRKDVEQAGETVKEQERELEKAESMARQKKQEITEAEEKAEALGTQAKDEAAHAQALENTAAAERKRKEEDMNNAEKLADEQNIAEQAELSAEEKLAKAKAELAAAEEKKEVDDAATAHDREAGDADTRNAARLASKASAEEAAEAKIDSKVDADRKAEINDKSDVEGDLGDRDEAGKEEVADEVRLEKAREEIEDMRAREDAMRERLQALRDETSEEAVKKGADAADVEKAAAERDAEIAKLENSIAEHATHRKNAEKALRAVEKAHNAKKLAKTDEAANEVDSEVGEIEGEGKRELGSDDQTEEQSRVTAKIEDGASVVDVKNAEKEASKASDLDREANDAESKADNDAVAESNELRRADESEQTAEDLSNHAANVADGQAGNGVTPSAVYGNSDLPPLTEQPQPMQPQIPSSGPSQSFGATGPAPEVGDINPGGQTVASDPAASASAGHWVIPVEVLQKAQAAPAVRYDDAQPWSGKSGCSGHFTSGAASLKSFLMKKFPGAISSIGGYSCRQNTANKRKTSVHGSGRALDIMIKTKGGRADSAKGDPIANYLMANAGKIGLQYMIWDRWSWSQSRKRSKKYGGPNPHIDHLHVEINNDAGKKNGIWWGDTADPSSSSSSSTGGDNTGSSSSQQTSQTSPYEQGPMCSSAGGVCNEVSACTGTTETGLCPGPANIKCCFVNGANSPGGPALQAPSGGDILSADQIACAFGCPMSTASRYKNFVNSALRESGATTWQRVVMWAAQMGHESMGLTAMSERGSASYCAKYNGRKDLGNVQPGDGCRFKGRGPIQLTGRANYRSCGKAIGMDLENNPTIVAKPEVGFRTAAWYWKSRGCNSPADRMDVVRVTKIINGGRNGLADRQRRFGKAQRCIPKSAFNAGSSTSQSGSSSQSSQQAGQSGPTVNFDADCDISSQPKVNCGNAYRKGQNLGPRECVKVQGKSVTTVTYCPLMKMVKAMAASGVPFKLNSGFRTNAEQARLRRCYETKSCNNGNLAARAGYSNHQSGIAFDINVPGKVYNWLVSNASKFGFIRTVSSEKWHWEYRPGSRCNAVVRYSCR